MALGVPHVRGHARVRLALPGGELTPGQGLPVTEALQQPGNHEFARARRGQRAQDGGSSRVRAPSCPDSTLTTCRTSAGLTPWSL